MALQISRACVLIRSLGKEDVLDKAARLFRSEFLRIIRKISAGRLLRLEAPASAFARATIVEEEDMFWSLDEV